MSKLWTGLHITVCQWVQGVGAKGLGTFQSWDHVLDFVELVFPSAKWG